MKSGHRITIWLLLFFAVFCLQPVSGVFAGPQTILDDYDTGAQFLQTLVDGTVSNGTNLATAAIGGNRFVKLTVSGMSGSTPSTAEVILDPSNHRFAMNIPDPAFGTTWIQYSGHSTEDACFTTPLDLTALGNTFFLTPFALDRAETYVEFSIWPAGCAGSPSTAMLTVPNTTTAQYLAFSVFSDPSVFSSVGRIQLKQPGKNSPVTQTSLDFSFHRIGVECDLPAPNITSFTATPSSISASGDASQLCWNITGTVTKKTLDPGGIDLTSYPNTGSGACYTVYPTGTTTYTLTANNGCAPTSRPVTVSLGPPSKVPNLNAWGAGLLSLVLAGAAVWLLRRKNANS